MGFWPWQEAAEGEAAAPGSQVSELQRLRCLVDAITADTGVIPKDSAKQDASGKVVVQANFSGVTYPDKLESFLHGWVSADAALYHVNNVASKWVICNTKGTRSGKVVSAVQFALLCIQAADGILN